MLPKPDSSLATVVPASTITAANEAVKKVIAVDAIYVIAANHGFHLVGVDCSHSSPMAVNLSLLDSVKGSYVALLGCPSY